MARDTSDDHVRFVALLAEHGGKIYAFIRSLTLYDATETDEVYQNACITAWSKFEQYDESGNFGAWVCRMAHYELLRIREQSKRMRFLSQEALAALADASLPIALQMNERREALAHCLSKLSPEDRRLIDIRYSDAQPPKEIARLAGKSVKSIYRSLSRIHSLLHRCVSRSEGVTSAR